MLQLLDDNLLSIGYGCFAHHYKILVYYKMGSCQALQRFCQLIVGKAISILKRAKKCKCLKTCNPEKGSCKQFALPYTKLSVMVLHLRNVIIKSFILPNRKSKLTYCFFCPALWQSNFHDCYIPRHPIILSFQYTHYLCQQWWVDQSHLKSENKTCLMVQLLYSKNFIVLNQRNLSRFDKNYYFHLVGILYQEHKTF